MSQWGNICRICASPADYEIFANIPIYLHGNCKDYIDWQEPINEMLEKTTGLKVSTDDGLPKNICALCISYLKHAKTFREQAVNTCLNFLAVKEYNNIFNDKKVLKNDDFIDDVASTTQRNYNDDDNMNSNQNKDQNKVSKQLMFSTNINNATTLPRQMQLSLQYLSKLYENNVNNAATNTSNLQTGGNSAYKTSLGSKQRKQHNKSTDMMNPGLSSCNSKRQNLEDDLPRTTSSDDNETTEESGKGHIKNNIFSYKEKNFEEDDIMDLEELKDAVTINIPSTCKEHKCSFCFKRFMFVESFDEHIKTCIEYKFATFLDEMNNLLCIRRAKEISPHEFIRRMIFSLRKTCEWLNENCIDTTLTKLLQNNQASTATASANNQLLINESTSTFTEARPLTQKCFYNKLNKTVIASSPPLSSRPTIVRNTPINMSNNILHEIERSESRNSQILVSKEPVPVLLTSSINTINNLQPCNVLPTPHDSERLAFMDKLQNAAKPISTTTSAAVSPIKPILPLKRNNLDSKPLINVRHDLTTSFTRNANNSTNYTPLLNLLASSSSRNSTTPIVNPCARCPECNLYFETLDALEIHNAMQHNDLTAATYESTTQFQDELDSERKRIIALFEDDDI